MGYPLGEVVRGGESERGRGGRDLVAGPEIVAIHLAPFWLPFRRSKKVLENSAKKRAPGYPNGCQGELKIVKKHEKVSYNTRPV